MMADIVLNLRAEDVKGAVLPHTDVRENNTADLKRWLACRGFKCLSSESRTSIISRVCSLNASGVDSHIIDPDNEISSAITDLLRLKYDTIAPPIDIRNWTPSLDKIPSKFGYSAIYEYLIKRTVTIFRNGGTQTEYFNLPISDKPLDRGYTLFASGHIDNVKLNPVADVTHVWAKCLASMKEEQRQPKVILDNTLGAVITASCSCPHGKGGKCSHVGALLFFILEKPGEPSCTGLPQRWHQPSRKRKSYTKSMVAGERPIIKHQFGKEFKRKKPLEDYKNYSAIQHVQIDNQGLRSALTTISENHHAIGLLQILNSSDSSIEEADLDGDQMQTENLTPEESVIQKLQVTQQQQEKLETETRKQSECQLWFKEKVGRITASNAKDFCGRANPTRLVKKTITEGKVSPVNPETHMGYGIFNEDNAVQNYTQQVEASGSTISVRECGLFVDREHGQLACSPDRLATVDGQERLLEVKCISSMREKTPMEAVQEKQKGSNFAFKLIENIVLLKEKSKYYYQVQMQMAITKVHHCDVIIFTNTESDVLVVPVSFDQCMWEKMKKKLLDFHSAHVTPALVLLGGY